MSRIPSFQFYPGDWVSDTRLRACSLAARGLMIELLAQMHCGNPYGHLSNGAHVYRDEEIARLVGARLREVRDLLRVLEERGVLDRAANGALRSGKLIEQKRIRDARAEGGKRSLDHPNVPRPKRRQQGREQGHPEGYPSTHPNGGSFEGSPSVSSSVTTHPPPPRGAVRTREQRTAAASEHDAEPTLAFGSDKGTPIAKLSERRLADALAYAERVEHPQASALREEQRRRERRAEEATAARNAQWWVDLHQRDIGWAEFWARVQQETAETGRPPNVVAYERRHEAGLVAPRPEGQPSLTSYLQPDDGR